MRYLPLTESDRREMLGVIGAKSIDELFRDVPAKARLAGTSAGSILFAVQRQVAQLHKWRSAIETGSGFSLDAVQPPVNFRRKDAIAAALRLWSAAKLLVAMSELADASSSSRAAPGAQSTG